MGVFSTGEMARRIAALRGWMARHDVDCVVATSYAGSYYLSGAPIHPFGRPVATIVPLDGDAAMVTSIIEKPHAEVQSWIGDIRTYYDHNVGPTFDDPIPPLESFVRLVAEIVVERGVERGCIGYEESQLPVQQYEALKRALPYATFLGVSTPLARLRAVLSQEELQLVRAADAISDLGLGHLLQIIGPGRSALELTESCRAIMTRAILDRYPGTPFHMHVDCGLGVKARAAGHSEWTTWDRTAAVRLGSLLELVVSVWLWGYWGNVERAVYVGTPTDAVRRGFDIMVEANETAIASIRPGISLSAIDRLTKEVFARHGFGTRSGSGCGRGIVSYEANAREQYMDLRLYSDVILEPGMAFSLEPDLHVPGIGTFRHCNTIIVTDNGCEVDSQLPRGPIVL
jgi:Xaa-Pro dipeptidase